jgi:hypothetical protein
VQVADKLLLAGPLLLGHFYLPTHRKSQGESNFQ